MTGLTTKTEIVAEADARHAPYPQYAGHWDGPEWFLVRAKTDLKTKSGLHFLKGEFSIARVDPESEKFLCCYSPRSGWQVYLPKKKLEVLP